MFKLNIKILSLFLVTYFFLSSKYNFGENNLDTLKKILDKLVNALRIYIF